MKEEPERYLSMLSQATVSPLPPTLRRRTLSIARTNLVARPESRRLSNYAPPLALVPSLLISAGVAFVVDAFIKMVRLFWA